MQVNGGSYGHQSKTKKGSWYFKSSCTSNCTYNHIRALLGHTSGLYMYSYSWFISTMGLQVVERVQVVSLYSEWADAKDKLARGEPLVPWPQTYEGCEG